jgi:hypothetical protein
VLTQNCPVGLRAVTRQISRIAGAVFAFLTVNFSAGWPLLAQSYTRTNISQAAIDLEVIAPVGRPVSRVEGTLSVSKLHASTVAIPDRTDKNLLGLKSSLAPAPEFQKKALRSCTGLLAFIKN